MCLLAQSIFSSTSVNVRAMHQRPKSKRNCPLARVLAIRRSMAVTTKRSASRLRVNPPIGKALPADLRERCGSALLVRRLAVREAEIKLSAIALQVRFADVVVRPDEAALEQAEERF